jgi:cardiolipin synthase
MLRYLAPTAIVLFRLASVPLVVAWIVDGRYEAAFWLFLAAGVSDAIDGALARRFDAVSRFGTVLDPVADKLLMTGTLLALAWAGHAPWWLPAVLLLRDALMTFAYGLAHAKKIDLVMRPLPIGRVTTGVTIAATVFLLAKPALGWEQPVLALAAGAVSAALNLITLGLYTKIGLAALEKAQRGRET